MLSRFRLWVALSALWTCGCASPRGAGIVASPPPRFAFPSDTFSFANELLREYHPDPQSGRMTSQRRQPPPKYALHCFVLARSARQFFDHSSFDPTLPRADEATYRKLVREVERRSPRSVSTVDRRIIIPGFPNLRAFSEAYEPLLKAECGSRLQSYVQRGHWRMIFPFSRSHQEDMARQLLAEVKRNHPPIIHVIRFPALNINHAILIFDATETDEEIQFQAYDPNSPDLPAALTFNRQTRRFSLPPNRYFAGGRVDVYEIWHSALY
jgi:hypothetical protein